MTRFLALAAIGVLTVAIAGSGGAAGAPARSGARCLPVHAAALKAIKSGLRKSVRSKLRKTRAVKAKGDFSGAPRGFSHGAYFISAKLRGKGIASWAVDKSFFQTGGGLAFAIDKLARRVSVLGVDVPASVLAGWGFSSKTYGFKQSRACVK